MITVLIKEWLKNLRADILLRKLEEESVSFNNYSFSINVEDPNTGNAPILGSSCALRGENTPDIWFKPLRVIINVPCPNLVFIQDFTIGSTSWIQATEDAFNYSPLSLRRAVNDSRFVLPLMRPGMPSRFLGKFTSDVPQGYVPGKDFYVCVTLKGIGTMQPDKVFRREAIKSCLVEKDEDVRPEWWE